MSGQKVFLLCFVFVLLAFSQALAVELKDYANPPYGYKISLPAAWKSVPVKRDDLRMIIFGDFAKRVAKGSVDPHHYFIGPQDCEYRMFSLIVENGDQAVQIAREFAEMKGLGEPLEEEVVKVKCPKTKVKELRFKQDNTQGIVSRLFVAQNDYHDLFFIYTHPLGDTNSESEIVESAKSLTQIARAAEKKPEDKKDPPIDLPAGSKIIKTQTFDIVVTDPKDSKLTALADQIALLDKNFSKIIPLDKGVEVSRPNEAPRYTVICKLGSKSGKGSSEFSSSNSVCVTHEGRAMILTVRGDFDSSLNIAYDDLLLKLIASTFGSMEVMYHRWIYEGLTDYLYLAGMEVYNKRVFLEKDKEMRRKIKDIITATGEIVLDGHIKGEIVNINTVKLDLFRKENPLNWAAVHYLLNSKNKAHKKILSDYFYAIQKSVFPIMDKIKEIEVIHEKINDCIDNPEDKEKKDELDKRMENSKETKSKLRTIAEDAMSTALAGIDQAKLQKELTEYFK